MKINKKRKFVKIAIASLVILCAPDCFAAQQLDQQEDIPKSYDINEKLIESIKNGVDIVGAKNKIDIADKISLLGDVIVSPAVKIYADMSIIMDKNERSDVKEAAEKSLVVNAIAIPQVIALTAIVAIQVQIAAPIIAASILGSTASVAALAVGEAAVSVLALSVAQNSINEIVTAVVEPVVELMINEQKSK